MSAPAPDKLVIPLSKVVPVDLSVSVFSRFLSTYEAFEYTGWIDESLSWKTNCYIGDWSPLLKLRAKGSDALAFFEYISTNHWPKIKPGQAKHAIFCADDGNITGEGLILMLDREDILFSSGPGVAWALYQSKLGRKKFNVQLEVVTDKWYLFQVQGPKSVQLLDEMADTTVRDIAFMDSKEISIAGYKMLCLRQGVSGEHGFELWGPAAQGAAVYDAIATFGQKLGIRRLGGRTKSVNHVEAAFPTPGLDFTPAFQGDAPDLADYRQFLLDSGIDLAKVFSKVSGSYGTDPISHNRTPYDLGWGWLVNFEHDFVGKESLARIADAPPNRLVTIVWNKDDIADVYASLFHEVSYEYMEIPRTCGQIVASTVLYDGKPVGCAVSRCYSYWLKSMISLAIIQVEHATVGTNVIVKWGSDGAPQKLIRGIVQSAPYKEDKRKQPFPAISG